MFTGLIQGMGSVLSVRSSGGQTRFGLRPHFSMPDIELGESVAVNGACLTVEEFGRDWFLVYASAETLAKTNLGELAVGDKANLERALALGDRLGGHLVSGHVDCLAEVRSIKPAGESMIFNLAFPPQFSPQVVDKGSVTLDGISLTVNRCGPDFLEVNIIPATQRETTIAGWKPGRKVNMETDLIGKYVQKSLMAWAGKTSGDKPESGLTENFLREHGF